MRVRRTGIAEIGRRTFRSRPVFNRSADGPRSVGTHARTRATFIFDSPEARLGRRGEGRGQQDGHGSFGLSRPRRTSPIRGSGLPFGTQSGSNLARALAADPKLRLCDEPAAASTTGSPTSSAN